MHGCTPSAQMLALQVPWRWGACKSGLPSQILLGCSSSYIETRMLAWGGPHNPVRASLPAPREAQCRQWPIFGGCRDSQRVPGRSWRAVRRGSPSMTRERASVKYLWRLLLAHTSGKVLHKEGGPCCLAREKLRTTGGQQQQRQLHPHHGTGSAKGPCLHSQAHGSTRLRQLDSFICDLGAGARGISR